MTISCQEATIYLLRHGVTLSLDSNYKAVVLTGKTGEKWWKAVCLESKEDDAIECGLEALRDAHEKDFSR